ncbi:MAG: pirin family protein [Bacteroidetes bacterium]|nr:pirin family protein [Bacteroidota bacterium]
MKTVLHPASSRGTADHGWLKTAHTFSFAGYYNPERINYGVLRVLNDDWIAGGTGFGKHPHDNMEIVTIPLTGALEHKDSMGNKEVLRMGEVQAMSAGTGVFHSEYNASATEPCSLLQIWVIPERRGVEPRYEQRFYDVEALEREWHTVVNPMGQGEAMPIHQQAWFSLTKLPAGTTRNYITRRAENGVYFFVIEGAAEVAGHMLNPRDGFGVSESAEISVRAEQDAFILAMDVPLRLPAMA